MGAPRIYNPNGEHAREELAQYSMTRYDKCCLGPPVPVPSGLPTASSRMDARPASRRRSQAVEVKKIRVPL